MRATGSTQFPKNPARGVKSSRFWNRIRRLRNRRNRAVPVRAAAPRHGFRIVEILGGSTAKPTDERNTEPAGQAGLHGPQFQTRDLNSSKNPLRNGQPPYQKTAEESQTTRIGRRENEWLLAVPPAFGASARKRESAGSRPVRSEPFPEIRSYVAVILGSGVRHFSFGLQPILHVASLRTTFLQIEGVCLLGDLVMRRPNFRFIFGCVFVFFHQGVRLSFQFRIGLHQFEDDLGSAGGNTEALVHRGDLRHPRAGLHRDHLGGQNSLAVRQPVSFWTIAPSLAAGFNRNTRVVPLTNSQILSVDRTRKSAPPHRHARGP